MTNWPALLPLLVIGLIWAGSVSLARNCCPLHYDPDRALTAYNQNLALNDSARQSLAATNTAGDCPHGKLTLPAGRLVSLTIDHGETPVLASVTSPEGKVVGSLTSVSGASIPLILLTTSAGAYRVDLLEPSTNQPSERFRCRNLRVREARPDDDQLIRAARLYVDGANLAWRETADQLQKSEQTFAEALKILNALNQSDGVVTELLARTLVARGGVLNDLSDPEAARALLQRAADIARTNADKATETSAMAEMSRSFLALGQIATAFECAESAFAAARATGEAAAMTRGLTALADLSYEVNDYRKALKYGCQELDISESSLNRRGRAHALITLGLIESDVNNSESATKLLTEAISLSKEINYQGGTVDALTYLGHLNVKEGQLGKAIELYSAAGNAAQPLGDKLRQSWITSGMGYVYDQIGDSSRALKYYQETLKLRRAVRNLPAEGSIYRRLGAEYFSLHDYSQAAYYFEKAISLYQAFKQWRYLAVSLRDMGQIAEATQDKDKAAAYYARAAEAMEKADDQRSLAYLLMANGRLKESQGSLDDAFVFYERALKLHRAVSDPRGESEALFRMALISMKRHQLSSALEQMEATVKTDESFRSNIAGPDFRASFYADVRRHYEGYIDLLMQMRKLNSGDGTWAAQALEINERGRARSLLETLSEAHADIRQGVDLALVERERAIQKELNARIEEQQQLLNRNHTDREAIKAKEEIDRLSDDYELLEERIRANSPRYAALTHPVLLSATDIQRQLDSESLLLEYSLGSQRSYAWAVGSNQIQVFELPERKEIEAVATRLTKALTERNRKVRNERPEQWRRRLDQADADYRESSAALSRMLIEPLLPLLGNKRLVIVADGALQQISFAALPMPRGGALPPTQATKESGATTASLCLIDEHEIVYEPSASVLAFQREEVGKRQPAAHAIAIFADPVFEKDDDRVGVATARRRGNQPTNETKNHDNSEDTDGARGAALRALDDVGLNRLERLRLSRTEAESIIKTSPHGEFMAALDFNANRATATSAALSQYRIIHFATHGVVDFQNPDLSGIVLSMVDEKGQPQDGYLRLHDIYNLNLPADLVVLSACQTGVGKEIRGEGLIALTRGFMYAGAQRVVASLWKVDDAATAELMGEFYEQMFRKKLTPAAALRAAQAKMSRQPGRQEPYYWAGFVLQGEWK